jgi:hypothetical protein
VIAGGAAYFFAKRSINEDRQTRFREQEEKRRRLAALEQSYGQPNAPSSTQKTGAKSPSDISGSPSLESTLDPAPIRHAPESENQRLREKSKYEASEPYTARKGDRFS